MIYLDNNGTTFMIDEVKDRIRELLQGPLGNPASLSATGSEASRLLEEARYHVSSLIDASPENVMFTSSASEANVTAVRAALCASRSRVLVTSELEHASIRELLPWLEREGIETRIARALPSGQVDIEHLETLLDNTVSVVSLQAVNNETGVVQPIERAAQLARKRGGVFHTDAAQAVGKSTFSVEEVDADFVTFTAHKLHGPAGVGALYSAHGWSSFIPLITGGSQEYSARGGTHNLLGVVGFGEAARVRRDSLFEATEKMGSLRKVFEEQILANVQDCYVNGGEAPRVCNTSNLLFNGIDGKALFAQLQNAGIECSQSSACTAQYPEPSKVLRAMGLDYHQAFSSIRVSFSPLNTREEAEQAAAMVVDKTKSIAAVLGGNW